MTLTLRQTLALDAMQRADPLVLCGEGLLDRPVRWVHSSEVMEIAPLLKGGELLLTSGLGLAESGPAERREYVAALANRSVTGLAIEVVGRTFVAVPGEMIEEGRRHGLPIVALRAVVPFVEITEEAHVLLVDRLAADLRRGEEVSRLFTDLLISGAGLSGLIGAVARLLDSPALLATSAGRVLTLAGGGPGDAPESVLRRAALRSPIHVHGDHWGDLHVLTTHPNERFRELVLDRASTAIVLELLRTRNEASAVERARRELIEEMLAGTVLTPAQLAVRCGLVGFHPPASGTLFGVAIGFADAVEPIPLVDEALRRLGQSALRAPSDGDVLALVSGPSRASGRRLGEDLRREIQALAAASPPDHGLTVALGPAAEDVVEAARSLREARTSLRLARELRLTAPVVTAGTLAIDRLLARVADEAELAMLVDEQLGPLRSYDERHGTDLVGTLAAYMAHGGRKAAAARALGLRRQTLYARLEKIASLLQHTSLDEPEHWATLAVALKALAFLERVK